MSPGRPIKKKPQKFCYPQRILNAQEHDYKTAFFQSRVKTFRLKKEIKELKATIRSLAVSSAAAEIKQQQQEQVLLTNPRVSG